MIKNWLLTGDTHGHVVERIVAGIDVSKYNREETALIILGDVGLNFYLNNLDKKEKELVQKTGCRVYCVRGNHEARPQNLPHMEIVWDKEVQGPVYVEDSFSNIKYFLDWGSYIINEFKCLVIGGAYSVDKWYRLNGLNSNTDKWTGWFKDEQLTPLEMARCRNYITTVNNKYDFVLTHTCPISYEPTDLFINISSTPDKSMELFLDEVKGLIDFKVWAFGHYHADRLEKPGVIQMCFAVEDMNDIYAYWYGDSPRVKTEYWVRKGPLYYEGQN